jgi:hypothetical protein
MAEVAKWGDMAEAEVERDRLTEIIRSADRDDDGAWVLAEGDYFWLICEVSRLRGEIRGIARARSWERKEGT